MAIEEETEKPGKTTKQKWEENNLMGISKENWQDCTR